MQQQTEIYIALILTTCIVLVFIIGIVLFIVQYRKRKLIHETEKKSMEIIHINELKETALQMQQLTMQDIGREIHDGVGQRLTLASIYSKQLINKSIENESKQKIEEISSIINESLSQLRALSKELTNEQEHHIDICKIIYEETEKIKALQFCQIHFNPSQVIFVENKKAMFIVRIVQEFLQNSLKYAECKNIFIALEQKNEQLLLNVKDDGKGFDTSKISTGIGLHNMKRRAEMIGATINISSKINKGTFLDLQLPF